MEHHKELTVFLRLLTMKWSDRETERGAEPCASEICASLLNVAADIIASRDMVDEVLEESVDYLNACVRRAVAEDNLDGGESRYAN